MKKFTWGAAAVAAATLLAGAADAATSPVFETDYGTAVVTGDDYLGYALLPFNFTFFGETHASSQYVTVSTNGFISLGGGGPGCCNGDVSDFLNGPARIAPEWFDLAGTVYLNTEQSDRAVFTFTGSEYARGGSYAAQAQLFSDGSIIFGYSSDSVPLAHTTLTGISAGGGVADPGETELTGAAFDMGAARAVYDLASAGTFDLNGRNVFFTPNGNGGYVVSNSAPVGGVPEPASWALMIVGFAGAGAIVRRRRKAREALAF